VIVNVIAEYVNLWRHEIRGVKKIGKESARGKLLLAAFLQENLNVPKTVGGEDQLILYVSSRLRSARYEK